MAELRSFSEALEGIDIQAIFDKWANDERKNLKDDEFIGENNLIYCKTCYEPRQQVISRENGHALNDPTLKATIPRQCRCQRQEAERTEQLGFINQSKQMLKENYDEVGLDVKVLKKHHLKDNKYNDFNIHNISRYIEFFGESEVNQGMMLLGDIGTGKTFYASVIAGELYNRGKAVLFINMHEILEIYSDFKHKERQYRLNRMLKVYDLVIVDDLGTERSSNFAMENIFDFFNTRYESGKALIITSNLTEQEMSKGDKSTARIYDRIRGMCQGRMFLKGKSKRG